MTSSHGTFCTFSWVVKLSPSFWQHLDTVGERINIIIMLIEIAGEGRCRKPQEVKLWGMEGTRNPRSPRDNTVLRGVSFSHTHDVQCSHILSSINWNSFNLVPPPGESVVCMQKYSLNWANSFWPQVSWVTRREEEQTTQQGWSWSCYLLFTDFKYGREFAHLYYA